LSAKHRHPALWALAHHLREVAGLLEEHGRHDRRRSNVGTCRCVTCAAELLAARGWPAAASGTGPRSSDPTSSTERAAGTLSETRELSPPLFTGVDEQLSKHLRLIWLTGLNVQRTVTNILAHAPDDDPVPAGSGSCRRCEHFCRPDKDQNDRIRSGYCRTCYNRWYYLGRPDRSSFEADWPEAA
jgi:hypothetical protein